MSDTRDRRRGRRIRSIGVYGGLAAVISILVLYLVFRNTDRIQYRLPKIEPVVAAEIDAITINSAANGTVGIVKSEGGWLVGPDGYRADPTLVDPMIKAIESFTITELVSTAAFYERYDLDAGSRLEITIAAEREEKLRFEVGKRSPTFNHTYVRLPGDERVFQVTGNLQNLFDKDIDALRDRIVFVLDPETVIRIGVTTPERSFRLFRSLEGEETRWTSSDEEQWDVEAISSALSRLENLRCEEFIDGAGLVEPSLVLDIQGEQTHQFFLFDAADSSYRARSSQTPYAFTISSYVAEQLIEEFGGTVTAE